MSIFNKIGDFFEKVWLAAKSAFKKLSPEQQESVMTGSGLIDVINDNLETVPDELRKKVYEKFPVAKELEPIFYQVANLFGLNVSTESADDFIDSVQAKLSSLKTTNPQEWAIASHSYAAAISLLISPKGTKLSQVVSVLEMVYQKFFKKSID